nr:AAA family ATPase [Rhizobium sp.]
IAPKLGLAPGARLLESDRLRRAMLGHQRGHPMPSEAYRPEVSERVYAALAEKAGAVLKSGGCVVANAVFAHAQERTAIEEVARTRGVPFIGIWLDADAAVLRARVEARPVFDSDATVRVLDKQLERGTGPIDWHRIDATRPAAVVAQEALGLLAACPVSAD